MKKTILFYMITLLAVGGVSQAWWQGGGTLHSWFDVANWSEGAVPSSSATDAEILNIYGTSDWPILDNGSVNLNSCFIGGHYGHPGLLEIDTGGTLTTAGLLAIGQQDAIDPVWDPSGIENTLRVMGGSLTVNDNMAIGWKSLGNLHQTGGTITVGVPGISTVFLGVDPNGFGYMQLDGGTLQSYGTKFANRGTLDIYKGHVVVDGGTARFGDVILMGKDSSTDPNLAMIEVRNGQLNCDGGYGTGLVVGHTGDGKLVQTGGSISIVNSFNPLALTGMYLGMYEPAKGIMDMAGGTFDIGGMYLRKGTLSVNGGTVNVTSDVLLVDSPASTRTDNLGENAPTIVVNSGELNVGGNLAMGHEGDGNWTQNGGVVTVGGSFMMSVFDSSSLGLMTDGQLNADNFVAGAGYGDEAIADFEMSGGTLNTPYTGQYTGYCLVGDQGPSSAFPDGTVNVLTMSGGTINTDSMTVGRRGTGEIYMSGGVLNVDSRLWIGTFVSGVTRPDEITFTYSGYQNGLVQLGGGQINVGLDVVFPDPTDTNSEGVLDVCGGTLVMDGDRQTSVQTWINDGQLVACGGVAQVVYDYNITNTGKTTVVSSCNGIPAGDLSVDCKVDLNDFAILAGHYLEDAGVDCETYPVGDIDKNCVVNFDDLLELTATWLDNNGTM